MIINNSVLSIVFNPIDGIKERYLENNQILKSKFFEPTILPIPDDAPAEIPRITLQSQGMHSSLVLSKNSLTLTTNYDSNFNTDLSKCKANLKEKIDVVHELLSAMGITSYSHSGIVLQIIYNDLLKDNIDASKYIFDNITDLKTNKDIFDINCKFTYTIDEKYYLNVFIENIRIVDQMNIGNDGDILNNSNNNLGVRIDINDRYLYNMGEKNASIGSNTDEMIDIAENRVIKNLDSILTKKEIKI